MMKNSPTNMDIQNKTKKKNRAYLDSDSENENETVFPRFLIIVSTDPDRPLSKLSPFVKMYLECSNITEILPKVEIWCSSRGNDKVHVESLFKLKQLFSIPALCKPHSSLNTSRVIISCPDLAEVSTEDIDGLADQIVIQARRITKTRDGIKRETNTIIVTFQTTIVPKTLKVGYLKVPVDLYIPNPLQCYTCFKFGHHESRCNSGSDKKLCLRCAETLSTLATPCADDCKKKL